MSLLDIESQKLSARVLQTHIDKQRLAHTYLLSGGGLSEQMNLVTTFVTSLFALEEGTSFDLLRRRVDEKNHPDIKWMGEDESVKNLKIEEVRDMIAWSVLRPFEANWKVFAICSAERLTVQAQNALLKTLEEPPAHTIYFLLVESKSNLLDTIRSRSFELRLNPLLAAKVPAHEMETPEGFGQKKWEDFFEDYQGLSRHDLMAFIDSLMNHFRHLMDYSPYQADVYDAWIKIMDTLYEAKEAINANANQKLVLTRLAMKFKNFLPNPKWLQPTITHT